MPQQVPLDIYRGDSQHWTFTLWLDAGATDPYLLSGATAKAEIRQRSATPVLAVLDCTVIEPNTVEVELPAAQSEMFAATTVRALWDLQLTFPDDSVHTVVAGPVVVTPDVTDSVAVVKGSSWG